MSAIRVPPKWNEIVAPKWEDIATAMDNKSEPQKVHIESYHGPAHVVHPRNDPKRLYYLVMQE